MKISDADDLTASAGSSVNYRSSAKEATPAVLASLRPQWESLAQNACEPNPFFEHWFLAPSICELSEGQSIWLFQLYHKEKLAGIMPITRRASYQGRPLHHWASWRHPNLFSAAPLVEQAHKREFWRRLLHWCDGQKGPASFLHLAHMPRKNLLTEALLEECEETGRCANVVFAQQRAMLRRGSSKSAHLDKAFSKKRRKELMRKRRRLAETGALVFSRRRDAHQIERWTAEFLALEHAGWKGEHGSSLASDPRTKALIQTVFHNAADLGKLERLAFHIDGKPVAMLAQFLSPPGAFSFKTCYDEAYAHLSPGMLLQVENLDLLGDPSIVWCDSCAAPGHPMIGRIWYDRREIVRVSVPIGGPIKRRFGQFVTSIEARRHRARTGTIAQPITNAAARSLDA
jgi:CelD/BcsL family acetyltransferase involved in cellulose biosynthesis